MSQRFLFVKKEGRYFTRKKSFLMGLRGFIEVHIYRLGDDPPKVIEDLVYLVNKAEEVAGQRHPG